MFISTAPTRWPAAYSSGVRTSSKTRSGGGSASIALRWGTSIAPGAGRVRARFHLAENRVAGGIEVVGRIIDEELAAVGIRAGVGHRDGAGLEFPLRVLVLVLELITGPAHAGAGRVATLDHEVGDHA